MSGKTRTISYILFLLFLSALIMLRQLMSTGYFSFTINDTFAYTSWAWQFTEALKEGVIYPRWMPLNFWGYGSPTFIFYPPLAYYLVAFFNIFTDSVISAMNTVKFMSLFLSAAGMFFLVKEFYSEKIAILTSVFYIIFPFNVSNLYISGAFASTISFMWFSPIMLFTYRYFKGGQFKNLIFAGACYGGLILTHLINAYMFGFVIAAFVIYMAIANRRLKDIIATLFIWLIGTLVSAAYLIPLFYEKQFINFETFQSMANYADLFILPNRTERLPIDYFWAVYYFEIAIPVLFYLVLLCLLYLQIPKLNNIEKFRQKATINKFLVSISLFTIFLQFGISSFLWENIPYFKYIQFPVRWLNITVFIIIFLSAAGFYGLEVLHRIKTRYFIVALFFLLCLLLDVRTISKANIFTGQELLPAKAVNWTTEHLPAGVDLNKIKNDNFPEKAVITSGNGSLEIVKWKSAERVIKITASESITVRIKTFYFPGWKAYIGEKQAGTKTEKDTGAMLIDMPKGEHIIELRFEDTPIRYYSKIISMISFLIMALIVIKSVSNRRKTLACQ